MTKKDWKLLQAYKAIGLTPEQVLSAKEDAEKALIAQAQVNALHRRLSHLLESSFIRSFDQVDFKTREYKRNISEADVVVALLLMAAIVACMLVGCSAASKAEAENVTSRFTTELYFSDGFDAVKVITDTETGVQYLFVRNGYGGGLTVLQGGRVND